MLQLKKAGMLSVLATAILLSACQPKDQEKTEVVVAEPVETVSEVLALKGENQKLNLALPECDGKSCPEISVERLNSNQSFIDQYIDQQILTQLEQVLSSDAIETVKLPASEPMPSSEASSEASSEPIPQISAKLKLEQAATPYMQTFHQLDQELKALSASHSISLMIKPKILNSAEPLATVVLNSTHYLGGAHGSTAQSYYNFDLEKQKLIQLDDIVLPKQKAKLEAKAYKVFKTWVIDSKLTDNVEEYEQAWKFVLTDNFYLNKQGLALQYAEYEIGPYVVGLPRLLISYDELQGILKPEYLPQPEPVAASEASASSAKTL